MNQDELPFEEFFAARMRDKGLTLKRLAETTGIAPSHLENMLHGNFDDMPSTPYFRGYVMRSAKVLDFDGEEWWNRIKKEIAVKNSGPTDALPTNRFIKKTVSKAVWGAGIAIILIVIYLATMLPRIIGKPTLVLSYPSINPYTTDANTITLSGTVHNADVLYLSNGDASSSQEIMIQPDGSWSQTVLLQNGPNGFQLSAKKLLGAETDFVEQILYEATTSTATSSPIYPTIHFATGTPATGTYFN